MTTPTAAAASALNTLSVSSLGRSESMDSALDSFKVGSMVTGVGVDIVDVDMFEELLTSSSSAFLGMAWTMAEQQDASGAPERLAARWAAKEAVMKALGRGLGDIDPLHIEVRRSSSGTLDVRLRGSAAEAAERAGVGAVHVSMSHEQSWAAAFAVAAPSWLDHDLRHQTKNNQTTGTEKGQHG